MNDDDLTASATSAATAAALPKFSLREVQLRKGDSCNRLSFAVPARSSALLRLLRPTTHSYAEKDERWLHLLQAVAVVPSGKIETLEKLVQLALQLVPSPTWKRRLDAIVRATRVDANDDFAKRALAALHLKDRIAQFLREWLADPIEGVVLWKEHVVAGMRLDDVVATPIGAGYLRGYRRADRVCIVTFPWGHGFIQLAHVQRLAAALVLDRKRPFHALEHQRLFADVESLVTNLPTDADAQQIDERVTPEGVDVREYTKLMASLQAEDALEADVVAHDVSFVRRVQALTAKTRAQHAQRHAPPAVEAMDDGEHHEKDEGEESQQPQVREADDDSKNKDDEEEKEDAHRNDDRDASEHVPVAMAVDTQDEM